MHSLLSARPLTHRRPPPAADGRAVLPWQAGDLMVTYTLEGPAIITLRASGTEPKLK
jgi:phosphomannomutase